MKFLKDHAAEAAALKLHIEQVAAARELVIADAIHHGPEATVKLVSDLLARTYSDAIEEYEKYEDYKSSYSEEDEQDMCVTLRNPYEYGPPPKPYGLLLAMVTDILVASAFLLHGIQKKTSISLTLSHPDRETPVVIDLQRPDYEAKDLHEPTTRLV